MKTWQKMALAAVVVVICIGVGLAFYTGWGKFADSILNFLLQQMGLSNANTNFFSSLGGAG